MADVHTQRIQDEKKNRTVLTDKRHFLDGETLKKRLQLKINVHPSDCHILQKKKKKNIVKFQK